MNEKPGVLVRAECLRYFQDNPYSMEDIEGLRLRIGRNSEDIGAAIEYLSKIGMLKKHSAGESSFYTYVFPSESIV